MQRQRIGHAVAWMLSATLFVGCLEQSKPGGGSTHPPGPPPVTNTDPPQKSDTGPAQATITLQPVDRAGYEAVIKKHKGKVVLVDVWATWCVSCREGFPQTVAWHEQLADKGLAVVSFSFDDEEDKIDALDFLTKQNARFDNLLSTLGEESYDAYKIDGGALPHYKLYGRDGKLLRAFASGDAERVLDHKEIEAAIRQALGVTTASR